jgi:branched-chain amino acid transport system ATP-binding protein
VILEAEAIEAGYGDAQVLFDVSFAIAAGEAVSLLGRNGMGKTTAIKVLFGLLRPRAGAVRIDGCEVTALPPFRIAQKGLGLVPEGRQIFPTLTVEENLLATAAARPGPPRWTLATVYALFPRLQERRRHLGTQLSGGEQQMLAIARALMTNPRLLVLDEATEGLAPLLRAEIWSCLRSLRGEGQSILIIDKNLGALSAVCDRHLLLERGRIVWRGTSAELAQDSARVERHLHV